MRPDQGSVSTFGSVSEANEVILRTILESPYPSESNHSHFSPRNLAALTVSLDEQNFNQLQRAYNNCMALPNLVKVGAAPLERELAELTKTFGNSSNWAETNLWLERNSVSGLYFMGVTPDDKDPVGLPTFRRPRPNPG